MQCECGTMRVSHRACPACGRYNGRVVVDLAGKVQARLARKAKAEGAVKKQKKEGTKSEAQTR